MSWKVYGLAAFFAFLPPAGLYGNALWLPPASFHNAPYWQHQSFLRLIRAGDTSIRPLALSLLGEGGGYYLGMALKRADNETTAAEFFEYSALTDPDPFQGEAYKEASSILRKLEEWQRLMDLSQARLNRLPNDVQASWDKADGLFELGLSEEARIQLDSVNPALLGNAASLKWQAARAAVALRLGTSDAAERLGRFAWNYEANQHHVTLAGLVGEPAFRNTLTAFNRAVLVFRAELSSGRNAQSYSAIQPYLGNAELYRHAGMWNDLVRVFARTRRFSQAEQTLAPRLRGLTGWLGRSAWAAMGRLRASAGNPAGARDAFLTAARFSPDRNDAESLRVEAAVNGFNISFQSGTDVLAQASWHRPSLFSRVVQSEAAKAVREERWTNLAALYRSFGSRLTTIERQNLEWTLIRAHRHGKLAWQATGSSLLPEALLRQLAEAGGLAYPVLMARVVLGMSPVEVAPQALWPGETSSDEPLLWGFIRFGLPEIAAERIDVSAERVDGKIIKSILSNLVAQKKYLPALRFVSRLSTRADFQRGRDEWLILYPLAYWDYVQQVAETESFNPWLFLSLVREESHFDPRIKSHVGATGLSQLMPATFRDQSARMRLTDPDIFDPLTNLRIGGNYFGMRLRQLDHPAKAMMAYNAGAHRVQTWASFFNGQPDEIQTEMVPFHETRNYVKKIMVTRLIYDQLYGDNDALAAVKTIYPNFSP